MKKTNIITLFLLVVVLSVNAQVKEEKYFSINKNLSVFNAVLRELNANYVDTLNYTKLFETGVGSMLSSLDPYTVYMPEEMNDDIKMMTEKIAKRIAGFIFEAN